MLQSSAIAARQAPEQRVDPHPVLAHTIAALKPFQMYVELCSETDGAESWMGRDELCAPESAPLSDLIARFSAKGFAPNKKAASASLLLRIGWAGGFQIASYLVCRRVPYLHDYDYALRFGAHTGLNGLLVKEASFVGEGADDDAKSLRELLLQSLIDVAEPIVAAHHAWSRFSRHALWAMVTSSWAGQFAAVARQMGDSELGIREARETFALSPEIARAAPELYDVRSEDLACTCQKRSACCLYFKSPGRNFCASCPILPKEERLERNLAWVCSQRASR
jgi:hypothetical protein